MVIVFDMDNTLVDEFGRGLRPGIMDLILKLEKDGHQLVLWTSSTRKRAKWILAEQGLKAHFSEAVFREDYDPENSGLPKDIRQVAGTFLVDDDPKQINFVRGVKLQGFLIAPYRSGKALDPAELGRLQRAIRRAALKERVLGWFG